MQHNPVVDDAELVRQAQRGAREAFVELVRLHQEAIRQRIFRQLGDADAADDLAQEVFLAAFRGLQQYSGASDFRGWLFGIARNKVASHFRAVAARRKLDGLQLDAALAETWLAMASDPVEDEDQQQLEQALLECLHQLAPASRQLVQDYYFENCSAESIGQRTGRKPGTVRMNLFRIRQTLGHCVDRKTREPGGA